METSAARCSLEVVFADAIIETAGVTRFPHRCFTIQGGDWGGGEILRSSVDA